MKKDENSVFTLIISYLFLLNRLTLGARDAKVMLFIRKS